MRLFKTQILFTRTFFSAVMFLTGRGIPAANYRRHKTGDPVPGFASRDGRGPSDETKMGRRMDGRRVLFGFMRKNRRLHGSRAGSRIGRCLGRVFRGAACSA